MTGQEAVRAYFETVMEAWEEIRLEPEEIIDLDGDRVIVVSHLIGRGKGSGIGARRSRCAICSTDARGRLCVGWRYAERAEALEAAGLSE